MPLPKKKAKAKAKAKTNVSKPEAKKKVAKRPAPSKDRPAIDYDRLAKQNTKDSSSSSRLTFPANNKLRIAILPFTHDDRMEIYHTDAKHFNVSEENNVVSCLGAQCPICDVLSDCNDSIVLDKLRTSTKFTFNVVDIDDQDAGIQIYGAGQTVRKGIMEAILDRDEYPEPFNSGDALVFIIKREGTGMQTRYSVNVAQKRAVLTVTGDAMNFIEFANKQDAKTDFDTIASDLRTALAL